MAVLMTSWLCFNRLSALAAKLTAGHPPMVVITATWPAPVVSFKSAADWFVCHHLHRLSPPPSSVVASSICTEKFTSLPPPPPAPPPPPPHTHTQCRQVEFLQELAVSISIPSSVVSEEFLSRFNYFPRTPPRACLRASSEFVKEVVSCLFSIVSVSGE